MAAKSVGDHNFSASVGDHNFSAVPRSLVLGTAAPWGSRAAEAELGRFLKAGGHVKECAKQMPAYRADECYLMLLLAYPPPFQGLILAPHPANPEIMWNASMEVIRSCWLKVSVATMRKHVSATDTVPFANVVNGFCVFKNIMAKITPVDPFTSRVMDVVTALTEEAMSSNGGVVPDFVTMGKGPRPCAEGREVLHHLLHPQNAMTGTPLPNWHPDRAEGHCKEEDSKLTDMAIRFRRKVFGEEANLQPIIMYQRK
ncbi:hypothetical protein B484DRAFT_398714 [Ochromonadaceae sp. CCMP2298]|nr:hypothetical protein B484DRAFT_398714 [Ochromonadaceae sp. CCMP2298]